MPEGEAIRFYCGVSEKVWNRSPVSPGPFACISPVYGRREDRSESRRLNHVRVPAETQIIQDSGAFSDGPAQRLTREASLERQIEHACRFGYSDQITHRASYDLLIDEKWIDGRRYKARWSEGEAEEAVEKTVEAATYLSRHRYGLGAVLSAQGVSSRQYVRCSQRIIPFLEAGDLFGLGGWCVTGKFPRAILPVFRETMALVIPFLGREGVKQVHIWGVIFAPALGELLYLCDEWGISLSTDSAGPTLRPCMGRWGYTGWTNPHYQKPPLTEMGLHRIRHVEVTREWLTNFRKTKWYRPIPDHTRTKQLVMF